MGSNCSPERFDGLSDRRARNKGQGQRFKGHGKGEAPLPVLHWWRWHETPEVVNVKILNGIGNIIVSALAA
jgi:hypothetical protein